MPDIILRSLAVFLHFMLLHSICCQGNETEVESYNANVYRRYMDVELQIKRIMDENVKYSLPYIIEAQQQMNISITCIRSTFLLANGLRKLNKWALSFLDATGKPQSGLMYTNINMAGDSEQCLNIRLPKSIKLQFRGKYCVVKYGFPLPAVQKKPSLNNRVEVMINLHPEKNNASDFFKEIMAPYVSFLYFGEYMKLGLCVPSGCSETDISQYVKYVSKKLLFEADVSVCVTDDDISFWTGDRILVVCIFLSFAMLVSIGTFIDNVYKEQKERSLVERILACFSITRNFPKLISTKTSEKNLTALNGLRCIGTFWVLLGHEFTIFGQVGTGNHLGNVENMIKKFYSQIVFNGYLSVDIFFFLSGFLNCYIRAKIKNSNKPQPTILLTVIHRLWRIYPALIASHLLLLLPRFGVIVIKEVNDYVDTCKQNWWKNFIFINNFLDPDKTCLNHAWYVSADMQLFLVSLITIPVLLKNRKVGVILHIAIIMLVSLIYFGHYWKNRLPPTFDIQRLNFRDLLNFGRLYTNPLTHTGAYIVGILMGHFIATKQGMKISKMIQVLGWLFSSFLSLSMLFLTQRWFSMSEVPLIESSLYGAFSKTLFTIGLSWMVFACANGYGGVVQYILGLKIWIPISRITFLTYLISPVVQVCYHSNLSFPVEFAAMNMAYSYIGNLVISMLVSLILTLLIDSPFIQLENVLFKGKKVTEKHASNTLQETNLSK